MFCLGFHQSLIVKNLDHIWYWVRHGRKTRFYWLFLFCVKGHNLTSYICNKSTTLDSLACLSSENCIWLVTLSAHVADQSKYILKAVSMLHMYLLAKSIYPPFSMTVLDWLSQHSGSHYWLVEKMMKILFFRQISELSIAKERVIAWLWH